MSLIQNLCLLLIAAHLLGWVAVRARQPELLGHMAAGVLLGPAALNWVSATSQLNAFTDLAVLFVVITAGLKIRLRSVAAFFTDRGLLALLPGILLPAACGFALSRAFDSNWQQAAVVGLCVAVTALPVALSILGSFGLLGTRLANMTIAGALLADVLVLLGLGMLMHSGPLDGQLLQNSLVSLVGWSLAKVVVLLALVALGMTLCKRIYRLRALQPRRLAAAQLSFALLLILGLAAASDALGLHFAIGAFLGAMVVSEFHSEAGNAKHPLRTQLDGVSNMIFAPLFLSAQGTHFTITALNQPWLIVYLISVAVASKLVGGYLGARLYGLGSHEAQGIAIVMNARGVMEMMVASIAYRAQLVDEALFSTLLLVGIVTTMLTPLLLKWWQRQGLLSATAAPNHSKSQG